jgi:L-asparaginase
VWRSGTSAANVEVDDDKAGFVASMDLNPQKSRVLLRLALLKPQTAGELQKLFSEY